MIVLCLMVSSGCSPIRRTAELPLERAGLGADGVVLEVYSVRVPAHHQHAIAHLWDEIDEQHLPLEDRWRVASAGFRVGVTGGRVPVALEKLMKLADVASPSGPDTTEVPLEPDADESTVRRRILQVRSGRQGDIVVSGVYDSMPVIRREQGQQVSGASYPQAQGCLAVKAFPQRDGRVRIQLQPEVQYGQYRQNWVPTGGLIRVETGRSSLALDQLRIETELMPGQILILTRQPDQDGSLGRYFFTDTTDGVAEQKLLLLRVAQSQYDDLFAGDDLGP
jgi:hypothetical protein